MDEETNRKVLKWRRLKRLLSCTFCPPNKMENVKRKCKYWKKHKSWKIKGKVKNQYETPPSIIGS